MKPQIKTLEQIGKEDLARQCEDALLHAILLQQFNKRKYKQQRAEEKNIYHKARREENKSPVTTFIMDYLCLRAAKSEMATISLQELSVLVSSTCACTFCEYVRAMKAAAAGAGHRLRETHTVAFSQYDNTISLSLKAAA